MHPSRAIASPLYDDAREERPDGRDRDWDRESPGTPFKTALTEFAPFVTPCSIARLCLSSRLANARITMPWPYWDDEPKGQWTADQRLARD